MSVANLPRYNMSRWMLLGDRHTVSTLDPNGEWVKFEEAVEASSNSVQQLQAKIRAVVSRIDLAVEKCDGSYSRVDIANELRELSAVQ